jgi:hypothetical protein
VVADPGPAAGEVEIEPADAYEVSVRDAVRLPKLRADPRDQLRERERLREVVVCAVLEAAQLRREVGACREDEDGQIGLVLPELP